ncbi:MAG: hypothetical protein AAF483_10880 [Planctomycetota bacterium]
MQWDPEIDTPATILVIGGNPVAIEAALYARFLGYSVFVADKGRVGKDLKSKADTPMPLPWSQLTSSLGLAALEAQKPGSAASLKPDQVPSHAEYVEKYLVAVAKTDLLYESIQINSPVLSVRRSGCSISQEMELEEAAEHEFRAVLHSTKRGQYSNPFDIALDCIGLKQESCGLGMGGGLACWESEIKEQSDSELAANGFFRNPVGVPKLDLSRRQRVIVYGDDKAAVQQVESLQSTLEGALGARLLWLVPKGSPILEDSEAKRIAEAEVSGFAQEQIWGIERIQWNDDSQTWQLGLQTTLEEILDYECHYFCQNGIQHASKAATEVVPNLIDRSGVATSQPHYYRLDSDSEETLAQSLERIRQVFALVGGREDLDLYSTIRPADSTE